jgi:hypothetical protein
MDLFSIRVPAKDPFAMCTTNAFKLGFLTRNRLAAKSASATISLRLVCVENLHCNLHLLTF